MVMSLNSSALKVTWSDSSPQPNYTVHYHLASTADTSQLEAWPQTSPDSSSPLSVTLDGLQVFTNYSISVVASDRCGTVASAVMTGLTQQSISTPPLNIIVAATLPTRVKVQWNPPSSPNGIITEYNVSLVQSSDLV